MTRSRPAGPAGRLRDESERRLTPEAARAYLEAPIGDGEREEVLALVRWFRRRYPEPADRLAYVRRASGRWRRTSPDAE